MKALAKSLAIRWSLPLTILLVVLAAIGTWLGSNIQLKLSLTDLLPDKHPAVQKFEKLTAVVGGVGYLSAILTAEDGKSHLAAMPEVTKTLGANPLVKSIFYHREERFFIDRMMYYLELAKLKELDANISKQIQTSKRTMFDIGLWDEEEGAKKKEETAAFDDELKKRAQRAASISPILDSKDKKHLLLMVKPNFDSTDLDKTKALIADTEKVLNATLPKGVTYEFTERYYNKIIETEMIQNDIFLLGTLSILFIGLVLLLYLRSWRDIVVIFAPVFMGLGFTAGVTYLWIGHINIITGFLMGIVSGLGVDYGIHLVLRLKLERKEPSSDDPDPVWRTLASSGHSVFTGAMSAAAAFFLLCFSDFRAFSEFGFICGVGITSVLACLLLSFSALARFMKLEKVPLKEDRPGKARFPVLSLPKGLAVGTVVTLALCAGATQVGFEYDFDKMMKHSEKMETLSNLVDDIYGRSSVPSALSVEKKEDAVAIENRIREKYMPELVKDLISGASIVPEQQEEKRQVLLKIQGTLKPIRDRWLEKSLGIPAPTIRTWMAAQPFGFQDLPLHIQDALRGTKKSGYLIYIYPAIKLGEAKAIRRYANMIKEIETEFPQVLTGSDAVIFSDILDLMHHDGMNILLAIFLAVGFFIWLNTRRWDDTLLSYLPLILSLPVGMGLMALFGVTFNIFNVSIIPTFVAMGIDVPIHIVHRTREIGSGYKAARDLAASINLALMTAAVGFGVLIFARAGILKSLGWIALLGTVAIWWVGMFILPAFLEWTGRKRKTAVPHGETAAFQKS